jgi:collagen type I/II/III/V/XI/XXIV/XXVII alpha
LDAAEFSAGGGPIGGPGTAAALMFGGLTQWRLGSTSTLSAVGTTGVMVGEGGSGNLALTSGATIVSQGATDVVSGTALQLASVTVDGATSTWTSGGELMVGGAGLGGMAIQAGGAVTAASAEIAATTAADGSSVALTGADASLSVTGGLTVGAVGSGALDLSGGAAATTGSLDSGVTTTAVGQISVSDPGTALTVSGSATVGDDGTGVLSVLNGATFSAASLTIGAQADGSGALVVSGDGSLLRISGQLNVGTAKGTGDLTVGPGATVDASVVNLLGGVVLEGGVLDPTVYIENGGSTTGGFGTVASDFILLKGTILSNGSKTGKQTEVVQGTLVGGGTADIKGSVSVNGPGIPQIGTHDTIELTGALLNTATTIFTDNLTPTGTYSVNNSVIDVVFQDATGVLQLDDIGGFAGTVATWHAGDSFVVTGGTLSDPSVSNGDTLIVHDSGTNAGAGGSDTIIFASAIDAGGFGIANNNTVVACFAAGTRIETEDGPVAVEHLAVGDRVLAMDEAAPAPIVWIGQRMVNCRAHPAPETVWPVRLRAGAFGQTVPLRDLYLSPDHAVFVNDVLVPVKLLINGTTIAQVRNDRVRYFHVELPRHAIILAEGLTVESYLDTGDRANFHQGDATIRLFPDFAAKPETTLLWETHGAARLVLSGPDLETARRTLARLAACRRCPPRPLSASG